MQTLYALMPAALAGGARCAARLAARIGRVQAMVVLKLSSIGLLVGLAALGVGCRMHILKPWALGWTLVVPTVVLFLGRTVLANCTLPLSTAVMMDYAPAHRRARWSSLQSAVQACWSASAVLGGVLADRHGYTFTLMLTAALQVAGTAMQASLLVVVPRSEAPLTYAPPAAGVGAAARARASTC